LNEATRVHHASRRRGGVVARGARAAGGQPTIGFLGSFPTSQRTWVTAFVQRLRELGWAEGQNIRIEYRWPEERPERLHEFAAELVQQKVDIIYAIGTDAALAAKKATAAIPIVFPVSSDPVAAGLVASLARPGANLTGLSSLATDLGAKRLELLREVMPGLAHVAIMANVRGPTVVQELHEVQAAARTLGIEAVPLAIRQTDDIAPALQPLAGRVEALYVVGDPLVQFNRVRINTFALVAHLPTMYSQREYVEATAAAAPKVMLEADQLSYSFQAEISRHW
jgi:putative tryptophan/tyrosine transport system substrate-binding protein